LKSPVERFINESEYVISKPSEPPHSAVKYSTQQPIHTVSPPLTSLHKDEKRHDFIVPPINFAIAEPVNRVKQEKKRLENVISPIFNQ
jgi:hypothetical protein